MGFFQISWLPSNKRGSAEEESLFSNLHARFPAGCSRLQAPWHLGTLAPWHLGTFVFAREPGWHSSKSPGFPETSEVRPRKKACFQIFTRESPWDAPGFWLLGILAPSHLPGSQDGILPNLLASLKQARFGRGTKLVFKSSRAIPRGVLQASGFLAPWLLP